MMPDTALNPSDCPAYITAGGSSSRFGTDKALVEVDGQPMLLRLKRSLAAMGHATHIVADCAQRYESLGVTCLVDISANSGPLAGLGAALQHRAEDRGEGWLLLLSVDQLLWKQTWFRQLSQAASPALPAAVFSQAVVFSQLGQAQPIPGLYHTQLSERIKISLDNQQLSLRNLLRAAASVTIAADDNPRDWSFNSRQDLDRVLRQM